MDENKQTVTPREAMEKLPHADVAEEGEEMEE